MFERMLDKNNKPSWEEFFSYCGRSKKLLIDLDAFIMSIDGLDKLIRFPYGNNYGWGIKYYKKNRHICDIFAEKEAFTIMIRLSDEQFEKLYPDMSIYTKELIDNRYPCGNGGWIHYQVKSIEYLTDIKTLLQMKINNKKD